jgi:hypothetical protein
MHALFDAVTATETETGLTMSFRRAHPLLEQLAFDGFKMKREFFVSLLLIPLAV